MKILISGQTATISEAELLVSNSVKVYDLEFLFDETWDGYVKTAVFRAKYASSSSLLENDHCTIPPQVLKTPNVILECGIYGIKDGSQKPTIWCDLGKIHEGAAPAKREASAVSPTMYDQMLSELGKTREYVDAKITEHDESTQAYIGQALEEIDASAQSANDAADRAQAIADQVAGDAAWVYSELGEDGCLYLIQGDAFGGTNFAINDSGELEVTYE